jgi:hypothetical protein
MMMKPALNRLEFVTALICSTCASAALDGLSDGPMGAFQIFMLTVITTAPFWGSAMLIAAIVQMVRGFIRAGREEPAPVVGKHGETKAPDSGRRWVFLTAFALIGVIAAIFLRPRFAVDSEMQKYQVQRELQFEKAVLEEAHVAKNLEERLKVAPRKPMPSLKPMSVEEMKAAITNHERASLGIKLEITLSPHACTIAVWDRNSHKKFEWNTPALLLIYTNVDKQLRFYGQSPTGDEFIGGDSYKSSLGLLGSKPPFTVPLYFRSRDEARLSVTSRADCNRDRTVCTLKGELLYPPYANVGLHQQCPAGVTETLLPRGAY